jgi:uncharacterized membrane protein
MSRQKQIVMAIITIIVVVIVVFFVSMRVTEGEDSWVGQAEAWMNEHSLTVELVAVWSMGVCFGVWSLGQFLCWNEMRPTVDQTEVGRVLRRKKFVEGIALACVGLYWGLVLASYYRGWDLNIWQKYGVVVVMVLSGFMAAVYCVRFVIALHRERWDQTPREYAADSRDDRQNKRDMNQQIREDAWENRVS